MDEAAFLSGRARRCHSGVRALERLRGCRDVHVRRRGSLASRWESSAKVSPTCGSARFGVN